PVGHAGVHEARARAGSHQREGPRGRVVSIDLVVIDVVFLIGAPVNGDATVPGHAVDAVHRVRRAIDVVHNLVLMAPERQESKREGEHFGHGPDHGADLLRFELTRMWSEPRTASDMPMLKDEGLMS